MNTTTTLMMALVMMVGAAHAAAEGPSISVTNERKGATRRVEIVIQDPVAESTGETAPAALPEAGPIAAPDGGAITGSLITGGKAYAVTEKKLLTVGEKVRGLTITEITLDRVTLSRGARTYELDVANGEWSNAAASTAE